jgi:hypothetical protein
MVTALILSPPGLKLNDEMKNYYWPDSNTIDWDPRTANINDPGTGNGRSQSPALGLGHEMGHACGYTGGEKAEKFVIEFLEAPVALTLGEDTRDYHGGGPRLVPFSIMRPMK